MSAARSISPAEALRHCREVTRSRAGNFYHGLKLLPEPQRSALYTVYAWMRVADDIVDEDTGDGDAARVRIGEFREETRRALAGRVEGADPVLVALRETAARYPLEITPFDAMIDGQLDDLNGRAYRTFDDLRQYCTRVASSVGLVCIEIWGYDDDRARDLAVDRGIALQLTNILRDFVEDEERGRVYLPAEDFDRHGLTPEALREWTDPMCCRRFLEEQIERAESYYTRSADLDAMIDPACRPTLWAMTEIYHGLLLRMKSDPEQLVHGPRVRLTAINKGTIALRDPLAIARRASGSAVNRRIAVIGGGVAGIAAAVRLAEAGCRPIVIETRKRLGGRATSFEDPRTGVEIDNCQHVLLGCCTNLIDLYDRLGVGDLIEWHRTLYWTRGQGVIDKMEAGWLPAPLHLSGSMRKMRLLDRAAKGHIRRAMIRMIRMGARGRHRYRDRTFADFLEECGQPPQVIADFWNTIIVSACNLDVSRVGAAPALQVFQDGFLANRWSYTMGLPAVPLAALYDPSVPAIEAAGGEVNLGVSARAIAFDGKRVTGVVTGDGLVPASAVVAAVPFDRLAKLVSTSMRSADSRLDHLASIHVSPILSVHLRFEQDIMELPHLVLVGRGVDWLFNKGTDEDGRQHLHAVISAADDWMTLDEPEIVRRVVADIHHVLPHAKGIEPLDARAIKEKRATFAATPDVEQHRPRAAPGTVGLGGGGIENLFLAGDWCDTGWPATMEGAVRSGYAAAEAITGEGGVVEDVPPSWLARRFGL